MTWPASEGIAVYDGSGGWGTSIADNSSNWNTAYSWGNHASAGYYVGTDGTIRQLLSSSATGLTYNNSTGVFSLTDGYSIPASTSIANWNTAYSWGDHSDVGYVNEATAEDIVGGVLDDMLDDAPIGVAVDDVLGGTTNRDRYMSPQQIYDYVSLHGGGGGGSFQGQIKEFTVDDLGGPQEGQLTYIHPDFSGYQVWTLRDGVRDNKCVQAGNTITASLEWQEDEEITFLLWPANTWSHTTFTYQNLVLWSEELQRLLNNPHNVSNGVTVSQGDAPDVTGALTMDTIFVPQDFGKFYTTVDVEPNKEYVLSWDVQQGTITTMRYMIRDHTNGVDFVPGVHYGTLTNASYPVRISVPFTTPADCYQVRTFIIDQTAHESSKGWLLAGRLQVAEPGKQYITTTSTTEE